MNSGEQQTMRSEGWESTERCKATISLFILLQEKPVKGGTRKEYTSKGYKRPGDTKK